MTVATIGPRAPPNQALTPGLYNRLAVGTALPWSCAMSMKAKLLTQAWYSDAHTMPYIRLGVDGGKTLLETNFIAPPLEFVPT